MSARVFQLLAGIGVLATVGWTPAKATVVNFSPLAQAGVGFNVVSGGNTYTQDGLTFTGVSGPFGTSIGTWGLSDPSHPAGGINSTALMPYYAGTLFTIAPVSGTFNLQSIDLAEWGANQIAQAGNPTFSVTFNGTQFGGGLVSQTFTVANNNGQPVLSTFLFSGFTNLTDVSVVEGTFPGTGTSWQMDNLVLGGAVPEVSTWAMMLVGFAGIGYMAFRRRSVSAIG